MALLAAGFFHVRNARFERKLAPIASEIARRPVKVHCQSFLGELLDATNNSGHVYFGSDKTDLKRYVCKDLRTFAKEHDVTSHDQVFALHTLAHEAWHLAGVTSEALAECYSMQTAALVAERLGADPTAAQAAGRYAYEQIWPNMPDEYRTSGCNDGGRYDLRPGTPVWP